VKKPIGYDLQTFVTARAGLAGALCVAASVALGGCASQPNITPELPSAPVTEPQPEAPAREAGLPTATPKTAPLSEDEARAAALTGDCRRGHVWSCFDLGVLFECVFRAS
jgi:hypothetical protein